jgi:hypothetical protein
VHDEHRTGEGQHDPRDLDADRSAVGLLTEEQPFVERSHESPDDHRHAGDDADPAIRSKVLDGEEREP